MPNPPLFPRWVAQHTVTFDVDDPVELSALLRRIELPKTLVSAVRKRQLEFLEGRFCVGEALKTCAPEYADAVVGIGPAREPLWPPGIVGSITHTHGYVSAAVARASRARAIGLDAEQVMSADQAERLLDPIADRAEVGAVARMTGWSAAAALTAIFSAKESIFKALYPEVGRYFDFRDAWIDGFDPESHTFRGRLLSTLTQSLRAGHAVEGRWTLQLPTESPAICTAILLSA